MPKPRIPAAEHNSCMQYIGMLSVIPIDELETGVLRENGLRYLSLKCRMFMRFQSTIFGGEKITILNAIIVTSMNSLRMPIQNFLILLLRFKRLNFNLLCEQETFTVVFC
ncbi:hypothetical protein MXB_4885 [Myxobolus squamalis]|nr:hypothetical protein MXB_4885 [Myxobolus squamalis]